MLVQQEVAFSWNRSRLGSEVDVLIDSVCQETGSLLGRSYAEAPEIDSTIRIPAGSGQVGEMVPCRITETDDYDLIAEVTGNLQSIEQAEGGEVDPRITAEGKRLA